MRSLLMATRDLASGRLLLLSLLPMLVVVVLLGWAVSDVSIDAGEGGEWLVGLLAQVPLIGGIAEVQWVQTVVGLIGQMAGWLLVLLAGLFLAVAIVGMLTPMIVAEVQRRHYPDVQVRGSMGIGGYLLFMGPTLLRFLLLLLLMLPLMFVPVINLLAINLPFYYWFHRLLSWDIVTTLYPSDQVQERHKQVRMGLMWRTALLYPLSLLPLVGLMLQVLFVLVLAHYLLEREARSLPVASDPAPR